MLIVMVLVGCQPEAAVAPDTDQLNNYTNTDHSRTAAETGTVAETETAAEAVDSLIPLLDNLNNYLKCVYYGSAEKDGIVLSGFTAFSIEYEGKFYLVTAGHCVEYEGIKLENFKFKPNFSETWIYPELLTYKNNRFLDYAVFVSNHVNEGLKVTLDKKYSPENITREVLRGNLYVLGSYHVGKNILRNSNTHSTSGESGSPVVNLNGEAVGILTGGPALALTLFGEFILEF